MKFLLLMAIIISYSSLFSKLDKITNLMPSSLKENPNFPSLNKIKEKYIEMKTTDEFNLLVNGNTKGILKDYNDTWIVLEIIGKKNQKELYYYRLTNITSIDVIDRN